MSDEILGITDEQARALVNPDGTVTLHVREWVPAGTVYFSDFPECRGVLCNPDDEQRLLAALKEVQP